MLSTLQTKTGNIDQELSAKEIKVNFLKLQVEMERNLRTKIRAEKALANQQAKLYSQHFLSLEATQKELEAFALQLKNQAKQDLACAEKTTSALQSGVDFLGKAAKLVIDLWPSKTTVEPKP